MDVDTPPDDPVCTLQERAWTERDELRFASAERLLRRALTLLERRGEGSHPDHANLACELADLLLALRRDAEAEALARRALAVVEDALATCHTGPDPGTEVRGPLERIRIEALARLGGALRGQGRFAEAEVPLRRALACSGRIHGRRSREAAMRLNDLGVLFKYGGELRRAAHVYGRAHALLRAAPGGGGELLGTVLYNLSGLAHSRGEHARAEPLAREALACLEPALGVDHPDVGAGWATLGAILLGLRRLDEAEDAGARALEIFTRAYGNAHPDVALCLANLSEIERLRGNLARAEKLVRRSLRLRRAALGPEHPQVASSLNNLAILFAERGRRRRAVLMVRRAHALSLERCGERHPTTRLLAANLATLEG